MDLLNFPKMINATLPLEAMTEMEEFRKPDKSWINQESYRCSYEDFKLQQAQKRYTIEYKTVPFECLYLPHQNKKLYVLLSGGGTTTTRKYPSFLRWKYKNILDGNILCIDDPMYHYHPEFTPVMWYYGTKEVSYLQLLIDIVKKFMNQLSIVAKDVTFVGSSGGGYSSLYCSNQLDYSSAIAMNPQFVLKDWQAPLVYDSFEKWGIDLAAEDKLGRNNLYLTNKTCTFVIIMNAKSLKEYDLQFTPFFERQQIVPKYGVSQKDNIVTWIHGTDYNQPHSAIPWKNGVAFANYLLKKAKEGVDVNNFHGISLLANEVLYEKFEMQDKLEAADKENNILCKFFVSNVSSIIKEAIYKRVPKETTEDFRKFLKYDFEIDVVSWKTTHIGYYIGEQRIYRYNVVYHNGKFFLRMLFDDASKYLKDIKEIEEYLKNIQGTQVSKWRFTEENTLVVAIELAPETVEKQINDFINLTFALINKYLQAAIWV